MAVDVGKFEDTFENDRSKTDRCSTEPPGTPGPPVD